MPGEVKAPGCLEGGMLEYLDDLRESGVTNMFGAGPYLEREYGLSKADARAVLTYWMATFAARHGKGGS